MAFRPSHFSAPRLHCAPQVLAYTWEDFKPTAKPAPTIAHTLANQRGKQIFQKAKSNRVLAKVSQQALFPRESSDPSVLRPAFIPEKFANPRSAQPDTRDETPKYIRAKRSANDAIGLRTALQWTRISLSNSAPRKAKVPSRVR